MPTHDDVRRIALSLPGTSGDPIGFRFFVDGRQFLWPWQERIDPKRRRVPNPDVIAVRVAHELDKETLIEMDARVSFTEPGLRRVSGDGRRWRFAEARPTQPR